MINFFVKKYVIKFFEFLYPTTRSISDYNICFCENVSLQANRLCTLKYVVNRLKSLYLLNIFFIHLLQNGPIKLGANEYACPYCSKIMRQRTIMERHILVHTGHKPFSCPYCPKRSSQKSDMERHITTHTGEKPYACSFCDYCTSRKNLLTKHIQSKHY